MLATTLYARKGRAYAATLDRRSGHEQFLLLAAGKEMYAQAWLAACQEAERNPATATAHQLAVDPGNQAARQTFMSALEAHLNAKYLTAPNAEAKLA